MRRLVWFVFIFALALAVPSAQAADAGGQARIMACLQRLSDTAQAQTVRDALNGAAVQAGDLRACYRLLAADALRQKAALLHALARKNDGDNGELWRYVMLKERDEGLRAMAVARSARAAGDAQTAQVLRNLLQDPQEKPGLRMRAALALADLGDESGVEAAVQELEKVKGETAPERALAVVLKHPRSQDMQRFQNLEKSGPLPLRPLARAAQYAVRFSQAKGRDKFALIQEAMKQAGPVQDWAWQALVTSQDPTVAGKCHAIMHDSRHPWYLEIHFAALRYEED
jgi:hypothetical protein